MPKLKQMAQLNHSMEILQFSCGPVNLEWGFEGGTQKGFEVPMVKLILGELEFGNLRDDAIRPGIDVVLLHNCAQ